MEQLNLDLSKLDGYRIKVINGEVSFIPPLYKSFKDGDFIVYEDTGHYAILILKGEFSINSKINTYKHELRGVYITEEGIPQFHNVYNFRFASEEEKNDWLSEIEKTEKLKWNPDTKTFTSTESYLK